MMYYTPIIQIQHGTEESSKDYWIQRWMRETTSLRFTSGSSLTHPTPKVQEFLLFLKINHVVFVLLYLTNILLMCETTSLRFTSGSSLTHPTLKVQEFLLLLRINHVVFVNTMYTSQIFYWCVRLLPSASRQEVVSRIQHRGTRNFYYFLK